MTDLIQRAQDAHLVITAIHHLPIAQDAPGMVADHLESLLATDDFTGPSWAQVLEHLPRLSELRDLEDWEATAVFEEVLATATGFLIEATIPESERVGDAVAYTWGFARVQYFYGETYEEALRPAVTWAEACWGRNHPARERA